MNDSPENNGPSKPKKSREILRDNLEQFRKSNETRFQMRNITAPRINRGFYLPREYTEMLKRFEDANITNTNIEKLLFDVKKAFTIHLFFIFSVLGFLLLVFILISLGVNLLTFDSPFVLVTGGLLMCGSIANFLTYTNKKSTLIRYLHKYAFRERVNLANSLNMEIAQKYNR